MGKSSNFNTAGDSLMCEEDQVLIGIKVGNDKSLEPACKKIFTN